MKKTNQNGFTLVELLVVIALIGISVGVTNDILVSLVRSYNKTQVKNELEQQANFVGLKLERELRSAKSASIPGGAAGGNSLVLQKADGSYVNYSVSTGVVTVGYNCDSAGAGCSPTLNTTTNAGPGGLNVTCSSDCFTVAGNPQVVTLDLTFNPNTSNGTSFSGTAYIRNTITIRNSY